MKTGTELKRCRCGYTVLVYITRNKKGYRVHFVDTNSGNYDQTYVCPRCSARLEYKMLED